jgi:hypothetical protein
MLVLQLSIRALYMYKFKPCSDVVDGSSIELIRPTILSKSQNEPETMR